MYNVYKINTQLNQVAHGAREMFRMSEQSQINQQCGTTKRHASDLAAFTCRDYQWMSNICMCIIYFITLPAVWYRPLLLWIHTAK